MIIWIVDKLADVIIFAMLAVAILSWVANPYRLGPNHPLVRVYYALNRIIEPLTRPARKLLERFNTGSLDLSLFVTMLFVYIIRSILIRVLLILI
jgi:uncharacterized protein YggT (Ycf19 family)